MTSPNLLPFLKFVASSPDHRHLLARDVHRIDYAQLAQLADQHRIDIALDDLRRAVRQFKRLTDSPFIYSDDGLL